MEQWPFSIPEVSAGLAALLRTGEFQQQGRRDANRFAASPQVALASPTGELVLLSKSIRNR